MKRRATDNVSLKRLAWMAVVVFGASLPHWSALPIWIPLLLAFAIAWRMLARAIGLPLPNRFIRIMLAFIAFGSIILEYRTINGLNAGSALLVIMVSLKFLESQSQRDQLVLMLISYFLVFAGLLYQDSALSGAYLVFFVWITTIGLLQLGRRGDLMRITTTTRLAGRLLLQAVPLMIVLFLLFPRLPGPLWSVATGATNGTTGLSDSMSPGDITNLGLSDEIAFRVDFLNRTPGAADLYWRGPVLAEFSGRTWSRRQGMWGDAYEHLSFEGEAIRYRVTLEPQSRGWAFALEMPSSWTADRRQNIVMQSDYQLRTIPRQSFDSRLSYVVESHTNFLANEQLDIAQRAYYLRLPEGYNPRTRTLMNELRADDPSPTTVIQRALNVFTADGYFYTLTPPALGQNSVDDFIFETKEGFCEHYASAFAVMMRFAGIPARVVTGYQGGEPNPFGEYYIVRESNAHAWTEVWLEDSGWIRVDPISAVAPERISLGLSDTATRGNANVRSALGRLGWARQAVLAWDAVNTYWNRWVAGYGPALQRTLLEKLGFDRLRWAEILSIAIFATIGMLVAFALAFAYFSRRDTHVDAAQTQFRKFVQRATKRGIPSKDPFEGPAVYGERLAKALPANARQIGAIVTAYLGARYEPDATGIKLEQLRALVAQFKPSSKTPASP